MGAASRMSRVRYEIDDNWRVMVYVEPQVEPVVYQPRHPDGRRWASHEEAEAFALSEVAMFESSFDDEVASDE